MTIVPAASFLGPADQPCFAFTGMSGLVSPPEVSTSLAVCFSDGWKASVSVGGGSTLSIVSRLVTA